MSRHKSTHDLSKLIKYLGCAPWDDMMDEMLAAHLGPACQAMDLEPAEMFDIIGNHWEGQLWGCAFEDLLAQEWEPDGLNIVDDYLKRRGWNEKAPNKAYMRALRNAVMSLYEVSEVVPGQSMTLRDLLRDEAPVTVREHSATQSLVNWDKIGTRLIEVNGCHRISGALLAYSPDGAEQLIEAFSDLANDGLDNGEPGHSVPTDLLRTCGPLFTNIWLLDCLNEAMPRSLPDMVNADGDDLVFHRIVFPLAKGVIGKNVARKLNAAQWLEPASDTFWNWLTHDEGSKKPRAANAGHAFVTTTGNGALVFANVELAGRKLIVEVNSAARAQLAIRQMSEWLGEYVSAPLTEIRTMAQVMADDAAGEPKENALDIPPDEMERIVHGMLKREYEKTLDEPVPALGNKSPRALARTKGGRTKVADWLKRIENGAAKFDASDPMATYDFTWIWDELGLIDLRR